METPSATAHDAAVTIHVTYHGDAGARFDRAYYVDHHLPLVMRHWQPHGLLGIAAFFPAQARDGTLAICECRFRDEAALRVALASPGTPAVMADLPNFTDLAPRRSRAMPLAEDLE